MLFRISKNKSHLLNASSFGRVFSEEVDESFNIGKSLVLLVHLITAPIAFTDSISLHRNSGWRASHRRRRRGCACTGHAVAGRYGDMPRMKLYVISFYLVNGKFVPKKDHVINLATIWNINKWFRYFSRQICFVLRIMNFRMNFLTGVFKIIFLSSAYTLGAKTQ